MLPKPKLYTLDIVDEDTTNSHANTIFKTIVSQATTSVYIIQQQSFYGHMYMYYLYMAVDSAN